MGKCLPTLSTKDQRSPMAQELSAAAAGHVYWLWLKHGHVSFAPPMLHRPPDEAATRWSPSAAITLLL